jgi:hypothetical protein
MREGGCIDDRRKSRGKWALDSPKEGMREREERHEIERSVVAHREEAKTLGKGGGKNQCRQFVRCATFVSLFVISFFRIPSV